jgi:hypothetical protein
VENDEARNPPLAILPPLYEIARIFERKEFNAVCPYPIKDK